jgi:hypothetical protein
MLTPIAGAIPEARAVRLFTTVGLRTVENGIALLTRRYRGAPRNVPCGSSQVLPPRLKRTSSWRQIARTESPGAVEPDAGTGA